MNTLTKYFPWVVIAVFGLYAVGKMAPRKDAYKEFDLSAFGAVPVLDGGRIKPLDSVARAAMLQVSGRSEWEDAGGNTRPAILWLLDTMAWGNPNAGPAADHRVFRVDNEQLLAELGLEYRPGSYRYSWNEILKDRSKFRQTLNVARKLDENRRDLFHSKVLELAGRMEVYEKLAMRGSPAVAPVEPGSDVWRTLADVDAEAARPFMRLAEARATADVDGILRKEGKDPEKLPPAQKARREGIIAEIAGEYLKSYGEEERKSVSPAVAAFGDILAAYKGNRPKGFTEAIGTYTSTYVYPLSPEFRDTTKFETAFNAAAPFISSAFMYIFAGVLMALGWLGWTGPLRKAALGLAVLALVLHGAGLLGRMYLMGRPLVFVTNLYSSALLIGFAAVAGCLVMESMFKNGVGLIVGTTLGAATVKIAHHLTFDGSDTLGMLVAVLDTNFWLASHVTTVTLGYSATYIAGFLGVALIFQMLAAVIAQSFRTPDRLTAGGAAAFVVAAAGVVLIPYLFGSFAVTMLATLDILSPALAQGLTYLMAAAAVVYALALVLVRFSALGAPPPPRPGELPGFAAVLRPAALSPESTTKLGQMMYGVICFATLLSFVGTVLGGIWADQSWGRFWGWDPKENGAVLIVIWNALILHARWGGMVKQRGMAVLSVVGIMVTTWSWFGTNQLGVGLHNYGFNKTLAEGCMWTWICCMVVIGLGLVPSAYWRNFVGTASPRPDAPAAASPVPPAAPPATSPQAQVTANPQPKPEPAGTAGNGQHPKPGKGKKADRRK